jgi:hypothetical protein
VLFCQPAGNDGDENKGLRPVFSGVPTIMAAIKGFSQALAPVALLLRDQLIAAAIHSDSFWLNLTPKFHFRDQFTGSRATVFPAFSITCPSTLMCVFSSHASLGAGKGRGNTYRKPRAAPPGILGYWLWVSLRWAIRLYREISAQFTVLRLNMNRWEELLR